MLPLCGEIDLKIIKIVIKYNLKKNGAQRPAVRGLRVYPYPRVRVGMGKCFTGTGIPAFTREKSSQVTQLLISFVVTVWWKVDKVYLLN